MTQVLHLDFTQFPWIPHPSIKGVQTQFAAVSVPTHPAIDALIARIEPGGAIPRHTHPDTCELAYVLSASGDLIADEDNIAQPPVAITAGSALLIPAGVAHQINNTSHEDMLIFAVHTVMKGEVDG